MSCEAISITSISLHPSRLTPHLYPLTCLLAVICVLVLNACSTPQDHGVAITGPTMGSTFSVSIPVLPEQLSRDELEKQINDILADINQTMSTYLADSELSRINTSSSTDWIPISPRLYAVLSASQQISELSHGAFDITVGALVNLWGFGPPASKQKIPDANAIQELMQWTGYQHIELRASPAAIRKAYPQTYLDLSGIASGYAADCLAELLDSHAISNYLVDISGEIRARGRNTRNQIWRVGIEKPLVDRRDVQTIIALDNLGLTTAGDYRNFFVHKGKRYSHTIDPSTGWPVSHNLSAVTVIDKSAMIADALDTALMVMGPDRAFQFAEEHHIAALFILVDGDKFIQKASSQFSPALLQ